ncbi:MAG TPA: restriction endonuclease subunit S [Candidatus Thiothrix moscowensis]|uniref:restriction endonuclease subunit S n=1 Tax=unclassified Thiothrix TaxID=2636184 RepID=UPI0025F3C304|nr:MULTISPECIES: restriction endonuclease subunit S [unclassified Thiothrix]HRJ54483.1 restriction endonuclease subunit S [Candidatus Thiothrix moscowensis]HRJ94842.1 restriction endonuclease subunit S [Candidatus Thiothrix moscowensis]
MPDAITAQSLFQEINPNWHLLSLESICEDIFDCPHSTPKLVGHSNYYMVRTQDIRSGFLDVSNAVFVSEEAYADRTKRTIPVHGDILLSREGTYFGDAAEVPENLNVCLGQRMVLLRPKSELIKSSFLRIWINSTTFQRYLLGFRDGTVAERLNVSTIKKLPIPVPSLKEQEKIISQLIPIEGKESINRQMNATLEAMAQALFKSWFVDFDPVLDNALAAGNPIPDELQDKAAAREALGDARKPLPEDIAALFPAAFVWTEEMGWIPAGWEVGSIKDFGKVVTGKTPPKAISDAYSEHGVPFITPTDIDDQLFLTKTNRFLSASGQDSIKKQKISSGSLSVTCIGSQMGKTIVAPSDSYTNQQINSIVFHEHEYRNYLLFNLRGRREEIFSLGSSGSTMPIINKATFEGLTTLLPSSKILKSFGLQTDSLLESILRSELQNITLTQLRDALLPKLLSGELRIPDAEKLVEEIQP